MKSIERRAILKGAFAAAVAFEADAAARVGVKLGFDTYSLRAFGWKAMQFLDYAAAQKLDAIQISSLEDYESLDPAYLGRVRAKAERLGIMVDSGMGCICPLSTSWGARAGSARDAVIEGLRVASAVGAKCVRCFLGSVADRRTTPGNIERCIEETIRILKSVRNEARDAGVKLAIENHAGDMQAREVLAIIQEVGPDVVGSCLDTGNPMWVMENPVVTMEVLGPYVLTSHVRDSAVFETPQGAAAQWVAMGDGNVDLAAIAALHKKHCPDAAIHLEIITGRPPQALPYFDREFWKWFEKTPAVDFVRFVELAKKGHPFMGAMVIEDVGKARDIPEFAAALREQQRMDLERSFAFSKRALGIGLK